MAQSSFPFENIDTTETQYSQLFRTLNNGVNGTPDGGELEVDDATAGLAVDIAAGQAMVRGHFYISTEVETRSLAVADPSNDRIDLVVLRLDPIANSVIIAVKTGVPDAAPVAPALVQTDGGIFEQPLANILVPANAGVPGTITDRREFMGTKLGTWTTAGRPDPGTRVLFGFNTTLEAVEFYNTITDAWEEITPASIGDIGDVTITGTPGDGELLAYDSGTSEWVNQALETAQLPTGTILQVVSVNKTNTFTTSSTSFTDVTDLTLSITPSSASNKIIVIANLSAGGAADSMLHVRVVRNGSAVNVGDASSSRIQSGFSIFTTSVGAGGWHSMQGNSINFVDSPAATSAVTYKIQLRTGGANGAVYVGRAGSDVDSSYTARTPSNLILMEVAG